MAESQLDYDVVDVFTPTPYAGNQLAVVHGAAALDDDRLLALAREFGYSETTFPTPVGPDRYRVRIFTPGGELPFAGHPTLGTAWVLRDRGLIAGDAVQECGVGEVDVRFLADRVELSVTPRELAGPLPAEVGRLIAADLGLRPDDVVGDARVAGAGISFVYLPVRAEALGRARVPSRPVTSYAGAWPAGDPVEGVDVYAVDPPAGRPGAAGGAPAGAGVELAVRCRVFVPDAAVPEDPATGSAAAGLGMVLVAAGHLPEGGAYRVTQGVELGRPSRLHGRVEASAGRVRRLHVAGGVHPVARGHIRVP